MERRVRRVQRNQSPGGRHCLGAQGLRGQRGDPPQAVSTPLTEYQKVAIAVRKKAAVVKKGLLVARKAQESLTYDVASTTVSSSSLDLEPTAATKPDWAIRPAPEFDEPKAYRVGEEISDNLRDAIAPRKPCKSLRHQKEKVSNGTCGLS